MPNQDFFLRVQYYLPYSDQAHSGLVYILLQNLVIE